MFKTKKEVKKYLSAVDLSLHLLLCTWQSVYARR